MFRTRFAPSPTGPLHLGHAYSALLAHDMARKAGGAFLLRMEDTDLERSKPKWKHLIEEDLTWLGLTWEQPVLHQSAHIARYDGWIKKLEDRGLLYPCSCSRSDIRAAIAAPQEGAPHDVYPGTCRGRDMTSRKPGDALRLDMQAALKAIETRDVSFTETGNTHRGIHVIEPEAVLQEIGDPVIARKGAGIVAYAIASALDDAFETITHVIRGEDLFDFTQLQVILLSLLDLPVPIYHHHGLIRDDAGKRLAKRDDARAIFKYREDGLGPSDVRALVGL